jgi:hypothetical protein
MKSCPSRYPSSQTAASIVLRCITKSGINASPAIEMVVMQVMRFSLRDTAYSKTLDRTFTRTAIAVGSGRLGTDANNYLVFIFE